MVRATCRGILSSPLLDWMSTSIMSYMTYYCKVTLDMTVLVQGTIYAYWITLYLVKRSRLNHVNASGSDCRNMVSCLFLLGQKIEIPLCSRNEAVQCQARWRQRYAGHWQRQLQSQHNNTYMFYQGHDTMWYMSHQICRNAMITSIAVSKIVSALILPLIIGVQITNVRSPMGCLMHNPLWVTQSNFCLWSINIITILPIVWFLFIPKLACMPNGRYSYFHASLCSIHLQSFFHNKLLVFICNAHRKTFGYTANVVSTLLMTVKDLQ